jgi:ABC-type uncharacterized transport system substrate-binding protein
MRERLSAVAAVTAVAMLGAAPAAEAHPHVWIDVSAELTVEGGLLSSVVVEWTLDPMLSAVLIHDFDGDRSGALEAAEQQALAANAFADLADYGYFAHLRADGRPVGFAGHEGFAARIEDARVVYRFALLPAAPVDPAAQAVALAFYDESFYIEMTYDDEAVAFADAPECRAVLGPDEENPIYFGLVVPTKADLVCGPAS